MTRNSIHIFTVSFLALALLALPSPGRGQSKVATTAAQFLGISVGPRAMGMGGAYVASNRDVTSLYWNPGAFQQAEKSELVFSHTDWLVGSKFQWLGFMLHLGDENAIGVSLTQLDYGEDEVTTVTQPEGTGERWSAKDLAVGLSYCRRLTDRFSMGGTVKYVQQRIWNESASAWAFDLGLLFVTGFNDLRLGVSMTNFGSDMQMDGQDLTRRIDIDPQNAGSNKSLVGDLKTDPWTMPLLFRVGLAMDIVKTDELLWTIAADALRPNDNNESINVGTELGYTLASGLNSYGIFLRGGYKSLLRDDVEEGLALGAGVSAAVGGLGTLQVDYAYTQFGLFGNLNTIAVSIAF